MDGKRNFLLEVFESWGATVNGIYSIDELLQWVEEKNSVTEVNIVQVPFAEDSEWKYVKEDGGIVNSKRTFFKIVGLRREISNTVIEQPVILQSEIGYLGIICKKINGVLHYRVLI